MEEKNTYQSALHEKDGVTPPKSINTEALQRIKAKRSQSINAPALIKDILQGNITALSKAITLVESTNPKHSTVANDIITACLPYANNSVRIGITGVPGVGKSTFIEALGLYLVEQQKKVAVLAVDPSSTVSKGSILGDKTRMETLVKTKNAFIRPSASGASLGGVARKTREAIILCEAAGFNTILIETVGVGQSETVVHSMVDFFLLLKLAGAGDELQGIKRGIIEMADAIVINKADGDNLKAAKLAKVEFNRALHLYPQKTSGWTPKTLTCSAINTKGIDTVWTMITRYLDTVTSNNYFTTHRNAQNEFWLQQTIEQKLMSNFYAKPNIKTELEQQIQAIKNGETTPFAAANYLLNF